jgi:osmotically-inducible protein OsmY
MEETIMKSDIDIQQMINDELQLESLIDADDFDVKVKDNIVILTGVVHSYSQKLLAERLAIRMANGLFVTNALEVRKAIDKKNKSNRTNRQNSEKTLRRINGHTT